MHTLLTVLSLLHVFELENLDFDDGNCGHYLVTVQSGSHLPTFRGNLTAYQNGDCFFQNVGKWLPDCTVSPVSPVVRYVQGIGLN